MQNLKRFGLSVIRDHTTKSAVEILQRRADYWLRPFISKKLAESTPIDLRTIFLFRSFLEYSGGASDSVQRFHHPLVTMRENVAFFAARLGVTQTCLFGTVNDTQSQWQDEMMYRCFLGLEIRGLV